MSPSGCVLVVVCGCCVPIREETVSEVEVGEKGKN